MKRQPSKAIFLSIISLLLAACAAMVPMEPARLGPPATAPATLQVERAVEIRLGTGYSRTLPAGSRWLLVGGVPQGAVYRRADGVFSVEGRHVHEAYLVVQGATLRGFYLPVEASFSPLATTVSLPLGGSR